jgi:predicted ATPase
MPAYILTGTPGAGKTAVLRLLETLGYPVVEEAATDVIALRQAQGCEEPWLEPGFIGQILALQQRRQDAARPATRTGIVFFDRSPACALALSRHMGLAESPALAGEITRLLADGGYEAPAFFIRNQGFVRATEARRISFEESLSFERLHEQAYRDLGFRLIDVPAGPVADRVALILQAVSQREC